MPRRRFHSRIDAKCDLAGSLRWVGLLFTFAASTLSGLAQTRLSPESRLQYTDMAVLESGERVREYGSIVANLEILRRLP